MVQCIITANNNKNYCPKLLELPTKVSQSKWFSSGNISCFHKNKVENVSHYS